MNPIKTISERVQALETSQDWIKAQLVHHSYIAYTTLILIVANLISSLAQ